MGVAVVTELEIMKRAKMYMDKLARGIDPISGQEVPGDSVLSNARLARCFSYVSGILEQVIANGGRVICGQCEFFITEEELRRVKSAPEAIRITRLVELIMEAVNDPNRKPMKATVITGWLIEKGFMSKQTDANGKPRRFPTETGEQLGISIQYSQGEKGTYQVVLYSPEAQRFILEHLPEMLKADQ